MSSSRHTLAIYLTENLAHKLLFGGTVLLWTTGMVLQKLLMPLVVAKAFDRLIDLATTQSVTWSAFTDDVILFISIAIIAQICIDSGLITLSKLKTRVMPRLHLNVFNKLLSQSMNFHANNFSGSLVTQTNRFANAYIALTDSFVINVLQLFILVFVSSVVVFFYSPLIALAMFIWSLGFIGLNLKLTKKRIALSKVAAAADSVQTGYLADSISNVGNIKSFSTQRQEEQRYKALAEDRAFKKYLYWVQAVKNDVLFGIMMTILQVAVLVISIYSIKNDTITIGTLVLAQVYIAQIISGLWGLSSLMRNIEQNLSDAAEMTEILQLSPQVQDRANPESARIKRGKVTFDKVNFHYPEDEKKPLFNNFTLTVQPGEKVGLVGHSGGGKTTVTRLLLRFMDIQRGNITIDGQNIASITQDDLRSHIAYVPQEPLLFHRSIAENIGYGKPDATTKAIEQAARLAHAHEFVKDLPHGYDTLVGERGVKLSGGQRQRVAIARAMIKDAPILVLDEATSALDSESERLIQDALWKLMEGKTTLVIAHRLSTIQHMDRIIVLDNGKIVEQGSHAQLLKNKKGLYAKLWAHQSGGFLED